MNRDSVRQWINVLSLIAMVVVNALANILPLNGLNTGEISDRFEIYFVPAGYVFSIWGLIYLALAGFAVYQALPAQRTWRPGCVGLVHAVAAHTPLSRPLPGACSPAPSRATQRPGPLA